MDLKEYVSQCRQNLHQIPEIGFDLFKTSDYVKSELIKMGYQPQVYAQTGLVVVIEGINKEAIAFRSDMDALMVEEKTKLSFASTHKGKMHACGHDGHMSILLGFAKYLTTLSSLKQTIILIFQPAEEGPGGAKVIIEEGLFTKYKVEAIFGIHLYPELEEGKIGLVNQAMMAQNGEFDVTVEGISSHGAMPQLGSDAIIATASLITNYQSIISRNLDPLSAAVITIGTIKGGEARNIIPQKVLLSGTIRSFNKQEYDFIKKRIHEIDQGLELSYRVKIHNDIKDYYPPVINDEKLYQLVLNLLNLDEYKVIKPMMVSEDFAFYQQVVPGLFMMLGTRNETKGWINPLHSCYFNFDESILMKGIQLYIKICEKMKVF